MTRSLLLAAMLGGVLTAPASAQQLPAVPLVQVGAGGRYETQIDPKRVVGRHPTAVVAAFRGEVDKLAELLGAMPEVAAPPAPVCHRLKTWIEIEQPHGVLAAEVGVMSPIAFENGRCHRMTGTGVIFRVNALSLLLDPQEAFLRVDDGPSDWFLPPQDAVQGRTVRIRDAVAFTHGRAPLLTPVSAERYLAEKLKQTPEGPIGGAAGELARWLSRGKPEALAEAAKMLEGLRGSMSAADLAKLAAGQQAALQGHEDALRRAAEAERAEPSERRRLEAVRAALPPAALKAPACLLPAAAFDLDPTPGCREGLILVELNPHYFDRTRPEVVQLLVAETPAGRTHGESDARLAARRAVWNALDKAALAKLVK